MCASHKNNVNQFQQIVKEIVSYIESSSASPEQKLELLKFVERLTVAYSHDIDEVIAELESARQKYHDIMQTLREFERMDFVGMLMRLQNGFQQIRDDIRMQEKRLEDMNSQVLTRIAKLEKAMQAPLHDYARIRAFFISNRKALIVALIIYVMLQIFTLVLGVLK